MSGERGIALRALGLLDLTDLSENCSADAIDRLCRRAVTPHGKVAAVCIWPHYVSQAARRLGGTGVKIATVINFPKGGDNIERALGDTKEALRDGADEIDLVMPWRALLRGDETGPRDMIANVADLTSAGKCLKVILETGALPDAATVALASRLAIESGANFIKTSTGKLAVSATLEAAEIMLDAIKASGKPVGFKAAGGVKSIVDAAAYLDLADRILGLSWACPASFRFGASALLDALLAKIDGGEARPESGY